MNDLEKSIVALIASFCIVYCAYAKFQNDKLSYRLDHVEKSLEEIEAAFINGCSPAGGM